MRSLPAVRYVQGQHPLLARVGIHQPWNPPGRGKPYGAGGGRIVMPGQGPRYPPGGYQVGYNKRKAARPEHGRAEEEMGGRSTHLERELQFFERVKQRLRNREAYQEFLKCLNLFATDVISKAELLNLVGVSVCVGGWGKGGAVFGVGGQVAILG